MNSQFLIETRSEKELKKQIRKSIKREFGNKDEAVNPLIETLIRLTQTLGAKTNCLPEKYFRFIVDSIGVQLAEPKPAEVPMVFTPSKNADGVLISKGTALTSGENSKLYFETNEDLVVYQNSFKAVTVENHIKSSYKLYNSFESDIEADVQLMTTDQDANLIYSKSIILSDVFSDLDSSFLKFSSCTFNCSNSKKNAVEKKDYTIKLDGIEQTTNKLENLQINSLVFNKLKSLDDNQEINKTSYLSFSGKENSSYKLSFDTAVNLTIEDIKSIEFPSVDLVYFSAPERLVVDGKNVLIGADSKQFSINPEHTNTMYYACKKTLATKGAIFEASIFLDVQLEAFVKSTSLFKTFDIAEINNLFELKSVEYFDGVLWSEVVTEELSFSAVEKMIKIRFKNPEIPLSIINGAESRWIRFKIKNSRRVDSDKTDLINKTTASLLEKNVITDVNDLLSSNIVIKITNAIATKIRENINVDANYRFGNFETSSDLINVKQDKVSVYYEMETLSQSCSINWYYLVSPQSRLRNISSNEIKIKWFYYDKDNWITIENFQDLTLSFSKSGRLTFSLESFSKHILKQSFVIKCEISPEKGTTTEAFKDIVSGIIFNGIYNNFVPASSVKTEKSVMQFSSTGESDQKYFLGLNSVSDLDVYVAEPIVHGVETNAVIETEQLLKWTRVENLTTYGGGDRVYMLDYVNNQIIFGNNRAGRIPALGDKNISIKNVKRVIEGADGVALNSIDKLVVKNSNIKKIRNVGKATGYRETPDEDEFYNTASKYFNHINRAVTNSDIEALIYEEFTEVYSCKSFFDKEQNKVKIVLVPTSLNDLRTNDALLQRVKEFILKKHISDRVICSYPDLKPINIDIYYKNLDISKDVLITDTKNLLDLFFDPTKGGQDGAGWPIGRSIYKSEIYWLLQKVFGKNLHKVVTEPKMLKNSFIEFFPWEYPNIVKINLTEVLELENEL